VDEVAETVLGEACLLNHDPSLPAYVDVVLSTVGLLRGLVLIGGRVYAEVVAIPSKSCSYPSSCTGEAADAIELLLEC
jgi:hypothetical protein